MAAKKRWIVLVGGGACGEWQAAALYLFWAAGLLEGVEGIVGTSVGGLNACVLAFGLSMGLGLNLLMRLWASITKDEDIYTPSIPSLMKSPWLNIFSILGIARRFLTGGGAVDRGALEALVKKTLGTATTDTIKHMTGINLIVRAYNYQTGQAESLQGSLADMALCTSAIEGAFDSWQGRGDGGAADNAPIDVALAMGAEQILVVYCGPDTPLASMDPTIIGPVDKQTHTTGLANIFTTAENISKANEALVAQAAAAAMAKGVEIVECYPPTDTGNFLDFTKRGLWDRGLKEARPALDAARALGW
jgi:predicted acylesterase/phospholipase RssA